MRRNSRDSNESAHASDRYPAISDEAPRENYSYCDGVNCVALGAIAIPSILKKDFSAITFLTLASNTVS